MKIPGASANTVEITYVPSSAKVASVKTAGQTWSYAYNAGSTVVTDPLAHTRTVAFNASSLLVSADTNENGATTSYAYCVSGDTNCPLNLLKKVTRPEGDATQYEYDVRGNVTKTTQIARSGFSTPSLVATATYPATCSSQKTCNQPLTTTDPTGQVTNYAYDAASGLVSAVTAPAPTSGAVRPEVRTSFATLYAYVKNSANAVVQASAATRYPSASSTCKAGDASSGCIGTANETVTQIAYEAQTSSRGTNVLPASVTVRSGNSDPAQTRTITITHDDYGNVTSKSDGAGNVAQMRYNNTRQLTSAWSADPDGAGPRRPRAIVTHYLGNGLPDSIAQGTINYDGSSFTALQTRYLAYDDYGRGVQERLSAGGTDYALTQTSYDARGRVDCTATRMDPATFGALPASACTLTNAAPADPAKLDRITRNTYESIDALAYTTSGVGTAVQAERVRYVHGSNGEVVVAKDGKGNQTAYTYDGLVRPLRTCFNAAQAACDNNTAPDQIALTYGTAGNATGRVAARSVRGSSALIQYTYDALGRVTYTDFPGSAFSESDITSTYDNLSRLTQAIDANTHVTKYVYDALGQVTSQGDGVSARTMQYDGAGRRTRLTWGDGFFVTYNYDPTSEMTVIKERGDKPLATFAYDDLGRRTSLTRGNGVTSSYAYQGPWLSGLTLDLAGTANDLAMSYSYNAAGQITGRTASNDAYAWTGAYTFNRTYQTNALNQYTQSGPVTPTYDARGNLTVAGGPTYTYNNKNQLFATSSGPSFYYDPLGRMDAAFSGSPTRFMQYDGNDMVDEFDNTSPFPILRRYVFGPGVDEPLVWYEGSGTTDVRYLSADERGSVVAVSDNAGNALRLNTYDEYGIPGSNNLGEFEYTGQMFIPELGMYNYKARIYSPTLGRFMQTDPIGYNDGMNWYNYVGGDPVNFTDPSGTATDDACETVNVCDATIIVTGTRGEPFSLDAPAPLPPIFTTAPDLFPQDNEIVVVAPLTQNTQPNEEPEQCNAFQRGLQDLGRYGVELGGQTTTSGLVITGGGLAAAEGSAAFLQPEGVVAGGLIAGGGANVTFGGGVIGTAGALLMLAGGSGKEAVADLASRVVSSRVPAGFGRELIGNLVGRAVSAIPFEFNGCK